MRTEQIVEILKGSEGISDYRINQTETTSSEVFFVKGKVETVRATDTTDTSVTVFVRTGDFLGDATFSLYSADGERELKEKIAIAKKSASLIKNKPYDLPSHEVGTFDSGSFDEPMKTAEMIASEIFSLDLTGGLSLNAVEVFLYTDTVRVINSCGVDKTEKKCRAMVEAIPTFTEDGVSVELYECYNFTEFSRDALRAEIGQKLAEVRDRFHAVTPKEKVACDVVLCPEELENLFDEIAYQLSFASVYNKQNAFAIGDRIVKEARGDALTVTKCGVMKSSVRSRAFDADGTTTRDVVVIENGLAKAGFGTVRFASYLGEEPTGQLSCIKVLPGTLTDEELSGAPYLKVVSMSGLQLDIYNDYIGGEVRLAYYIDGDKVTPVTGISLSGKLSEALNSLRLLDKVCSAGNYEGPVLAKISGVEIV